jgi:transcriptional regulator with XRE-family HTH domain
MKASKLFRNPDGLAATRARLGMSQRDFAQTLGISKALVSMVEGNRRTLPVPCLVKLASLEVAVSGAVTADLKQLPHPVEVEAHYLNEHAPVMLEYKEMHCRAEARMLESKLEVMGTRYQQLRANLEGIEKLLDETACLQDSPLRPCLEVHRYSLSRKLTRLGLPAQAALRNKIGLLHAAAELHKSVRQQFHGETVNGEGRTDEG